MIWVAHLGQTKWKARGVLTDYIFQNPENIVPIRIVCCMIYIVYLRDRGCSSRDRIVIGLKQNQ